MKLYLAPLEGITGYVYRNIWGDMFGGADRCFTPFLSPNQNYSFQSKELNDVLPEHNQQMETVPQILANRADYFLWAAEELRKMGYGEVNLNLGCPSGTVVAKQKGSGLLAYPEKLDRFLDDIFSGAKVRVSIKTRLGKESPEEFEGLLEIFNQYPLAELIIHPRVQKDFYGNTPDLSSYLKAQDSCSYPVCYNGDIFTLADYQAFSEAFPETGRLMLGRGVLANPALVREIRGGDKLQKDELRSFHDRLLAEYVRLMSGDRPVLFKMKELWNYMAWMFTEPAKVLKKVRKTSYVKDYKAAAEEILRGMELAEGAGFQPS